MSQKRHYNVRVFIEEVTEATPEIIERGVRVAGPTNKSTKELVTVKTTSDNLNTAIDRITSTLELYRESED